jgi:hypothetical protein
MLTRGGSLPKAAFGKTISGSSLRVTSLVDELPPPPPQAVPTSTTEQSAHAKSERVGPIHDRFANPAIARSRSERSLRNIGFVSSPAASLGPVAIARHNLLGLVALACYGTVKSSRTRLDRRLCREPIGDELGGGLAAYRGIRLGQAHRSRGCPVRVTLRSYCGRQDGH